MDTIYTHEYACYKCGKTREAMAEDVFTKQETSYQKLYTRGVEFDDKTWIHVLLIYILIYLITFSEIRGFCSISVE
jgi:hypothetical protein